MFCVNLFCFRKRLPDFTQRALVKAGILVQVRNCIYALNNKLNIIDQFDDSLLHTAQVYNYKKAKELPLRGGKMLQVEAKETVTFYKVRFHLVRFPRSSCEELGNLTRFHMTLKPPAWRKCLTSNTRWVQTFTWRPKAGSICRMCRRSTGRGSSKTLHHRGATIS